MSDRVCLQCGTDYDGSADGIVLYSWCDGCSEKRTFGTEKEFRYHQ